MVCRLHFCINAS
jgi:hypothetical protein